MDEAKRRSYNQFCGLARALDVLGGRWNLLIVRELLVRPARYGELQAGLPGIATNLLAGRLRDLEDAGVVARSLDPNANGVLYSLTPWGKELRGAVNELVSWSTPLMISGPNPDDEFKPHWLVVALGALLAGKRVDSPTKVGLQVDGIMVVIDADTDGTRVELAGESQPETVLSGDPAFFLGLASGMLTVEQAMEGTSLRGSLRDLFAVFGAEDKHQRVESR